MVFKGWGATGCQRVIVAQWLEHWQLKPDVLGSIPGGATFLPTHMLFQRSMDSNDAGCVLLMRCQEVFGLHLHLRMWASSNGLAVFTLKNFILQLFFMQHKSVINSVVSNNVSNTCTHSHTSTHCIPCSQHSYQQSPPHTH